MAMDLGGGGQGGPKSDINVTPLVDVMLVLLIIMMLVAPMLQKGVDVRLPKAANTEDHPDTQDQVVLAITADNRVFVNSVEVRKAELITRVQEALDKTSEKLVLLKADEEVPYAAVMETMDELRKIAVEDIGLITDRKLTTVGGN
jgi:biopolymer transport protein ExbD